MIIDLNGENVMEKLMGYGLSADNAKSFIKTANKLFDDEFDDDAVVHFFETNNELDAIFAVDFYDSTEELYATEYFTCAMAGTISEKKFNNRIKDFVKKYDKYEGMSATIIPKNNSRIRPCFVSAKARKPAIDAYRQFLAKQSHVE